MSEWISACGTDHVTEQCIQVRRIGPNGAIRIRDSKDPDGPVLVFSRAEWDRFFLAMRDGTFDSV